MATLLPSDICVKTETGKYFFLKGKSKMKIMSTRVLKSWDFPRIVDVLESDLVVYTTGTLGFRGGSVIQVFSTSKVYLISDNLKRQIKDPKWLDLLGGKALIVSETEANIHKDGVELS